MSKKKTTEEIESSDPLTAPADSDVVVSGAGSPCNGRYDYRDADHWKGPGGVFHLARVTDYPIPGGISWAILQDESIHYVGADTPLPWESVWEIGSFGAAPVPQVQAAIEPGNNISQFQMTSTETRVLSHDDFWKIKLVS